ncbi:unnamed protein product, partial [Oncorhynchus mykiss]
EFTQTLLSCFLGFETLQIGSNLKNVIRAFRLFDYNRDGQIQQHELRRILENYCFPLSQRDYQRLWTHHSPNNMATMSYKVFLEKLGLESNKCRKLVPEPPKLALGWQEMSPPDKIKLRNSALSQNATGDTQEIQGLTQDELQTLFLEKDREDHQGRPSSGFGSPPV